MSDEVFEVQPGQLGYEQVATVVCGDCESTFSEFFVNIEELIPIIEREGWKLDAQGMWICPECAKVRGIR